MNEKKIAIIGSGTAGLIAALIIKSLFESYTVTVVSSSKKGIIGVGEGSTEHWRQFQDYCQIDPMDMIINTDATYKLGIRFEGWTNHTPDYFHSINSSGALHKGNFIPSYADAVLKNELLTDKFSSLGIRDSKIDRIKDHPNYANQFHFDTFKINEYLIKIVQ
jgi:2-polyprenyl-6-methoxyphenol hydroxylase-like FAD-dependent oxidoreductase